MLQPFEQCPHFILGTPIMNLFDFSWAPILLFYAYIPILILSIFFGLFIFVKDKYAIRGQYFLLMNLAFVAYILLSLVQWVAVNAEIILFAWQIYIFAEIGIFLFSVLFAYAFLFKQDVSTLYRNTAILIWAIIALILPTRLNIDSFDIINCEGISGKIWTYVYIFELVLIVLILLITLMKLRRKESRTEKVKTILFSSGLILGLGIFWASNYFGEITLTYEINLIGPAGMLLLIGMLSYMIVKFNVFNTKLFASQILILALLLFIASLLFVQRMDIIHLVVLFTFGLVSILGAILVKSVKKEIDQRMEIEKLAVNLEAANKQKDTVLHMVAHQLKGPISVINYSTELLIDGDFGNLTSEQSKAVQTIRTAGENMKDQSEMILVAAQISTGNKLPIEPEILDLNDFFAGIVSTASIKAKERKVDLKVSVPSKLPKATLDKKFTQWAIDNLLNNAIKYTAIKMEEGGGKVDFKVTVKDDLLFCTIKDNGIGIPDDYKDKMFKELSRAANAGKEGSGLGLHIAKGAIESQGGKIRFESKENVGTTFYVELPIKLAVKKKKK